MKYSEMLENNTNIRIFEQLNYTLLDKGKRGEIISHNLEKGLNNEAALRNVMRTFFPLRFGIGKGKVINQDGNLSGQCDIIIYDAIHCPKLFVDENDNQIIPIEGVYAVIQVKTTLDSEKLKIAFENLQSVYSLYPRCDNRSINPCIVYRPPDLSVIAFHDDRKLSTICHNYVKLSKQFKVDHNFQLYSKRSAGHFRVSKDRHLVSEVVILGKGSVHAMLDGTVKIDNFGDFTLGIFLTSMFKDFSQINSQAFENILSYFNHIMVREIQNE